MISPNRILTIIPRICFVSPILKNSFWHPNEDMDRISISQTKMINRSTIIFFLFGLSRVFSVVIVKNELFDLYKGKYKKTKLHR